MNEKLYIFKGKAKLRLTQVRNQAQIARMKQKQVVWSEEEEEEEEEESNLSFVEIWVRKNCMEKRVRLFG